MGKTPLRRVPLGGERRGRPQLSAREGREGKVSALLIGMGRGLLGRGEEEARGGGGGERKAGQGGSGPRPDAGVVSPFFLFLFSKTFSKANFEQKQKIKTETHNTK